MRAVERNILVRYVVNDDPKQIAVVERLFGQCQASAPKSRGARRCDVVRRNG
jgi:hypothetical protein